jgi:hypothetical protein
MTPFSDGIRARRFAVALIVANFAVWLFYELPNGDEAINGCTQRHVKTGALPVQAPCHAGQPSLQIAVTNHIDGRRRLAQRWNYLAQR